MVLGLICVAVCTVYICWSLLKMQFRMPKPHRGTRHPPCLPTLPFVGSFPFLATQVNDLAHQLMEKSKSMGTIFALYFGSRYVVVLNDVTVIREALQKKSLQFASRTPFYLEENHLTVNGKGIAGAKYDDAFRRKHHLFMSILRRLGVGQRLMETRINDSVEEFIKHVRTTGGRPFDPDEAITLSILSIMTSILIGHRYAIHHPTLVALKNQIRELLKCVISPVDFFPLLRFVPSYRGRMNWTITSHALLLKTLDKMLSDAMSKEELPVDVADDDSFIHQYTESTKTADTNNQSTVATADLDDIDRQPAMKFDREELLYSIRDFFAGGTHTTATTIRWFLLMMANHRDLQTHMYKEIDAVVGRGRLPSSEDEQLLPYSQAVIMETMRRFTLGPLARFHSTTCDTAVGDFFVPANTTVVVNLYSVHMDPAVWKDPTEFVPERFLDQDGAFCGKDRLLPFSLGKRSCIGESLARQELFLFLVGIVQNFDVCPAEGVREITYETLSGVTVKPTTFEVRMIPRFI